MSNKKQEQKQELTQERKAEKFDEIFQIVEKAMAKNWSLDDIGVEVIKITARW